MPKPFVIITVRPTGAGKSNLVKKTIIDCELPVTDLAKFPVFRVDDLVTQRNDYKKTVNFLLQSPEISRLQTGYEDVVDKTDVVDKIDVADKNYSFLMENMGSAYFHSRKMHGCYNKTDEAILTPNSIDDHDKFYKIQMAVLKKRFLKLRKK